MIDGETLSQTAGFVSVPAGHANIGGWTALNRPRTYFADLDGDGQAEVISAINGVWNRVTIWDNAGRAKHNVQFGPGEKAPAVTLSDMDLCDLDGDGSLEVLVAKQTDGLVVALNHELAKRWVAALPSGPCVLRAAEKATRSWAAWTARPVLARRGRWRRGEGNGQADRGRHSRHRDSGRWVATDAGMSGCLPQVTRTLSADRAPQRPSVCEPGGRKAPTAGSPCRGLGRTVGRPEGDRQPPLGSHVPAGLQARTWGRVQR